MSFSKDNVTAQWKGCEEMDWAETYCIEIVT